MVRILSDMYQFVCMLLRYSSMQQPFVDMASNPLNEVGEGGGGIHTFVALCPPLLVIHVELDWLI